MPRVPFEDSPSFPPRVIADIIVRGSDVLRTHTLDVDYIQTETCISLPRRFRREHDERWERDRKRDGIRVRYSRRGVKVSPVIPIVRKMRLQREHVICDPVKPRLRTLRS